MRGDGASARRPAWISFIRLSRCDNSRTTCWAYLEPACDPGPRLLVDAARRAFATLPLVQDAPGGRSRERPGVPVAGRSSNLPGRGLKLDVNEGRRRLF